MKVVQQISLLALALTLASCNEKVSPELQNASVTTGGATSGSTSGSGSGTTVPTFSMKVTSDTDPYLNFQLHKTGPGYKPDALLTTDDCEVKKTTSTFARSAFGVTHLDPIPDEANDITCYLEAEELALYHQGLKLKVEATPGTCTYVRYSPYSYYNRQPGNSSGTYNKIICANENTTAAHVDIAFANSLPLPTTSKILYGAGPSKIGCDDYLIESYKSSNQAVDLPVATASRAPFTVKDDNVAPELSAEDQLCRFNYPDLNQEKCDVGTITIVDHTVTYDSEKAAAAAALVADASALASNSMYGTYTDTSDDDTTGPDDGLSGLSSDEATAIRATSEYTTEYSPAYTAEITANAPTFTKKTVAKRTINCGGKVTNCVAGPIKSHTDLPWPSGNLVTSPAPAETYSKTYTYPSLYPTRGGTYVYANYRRELAESNIDYGDITNPIYSDAFIDKKVFDPRVLDMFSSLRSYAGVALISSANWEANSIEASKFSARPYAAESFMGISSYKGTSNTVNPFYTFECLDNARETTARIRVMVRDWNRIIPTTGDATELVSDIFNSSDSYQDNNSVETNYGYDVDSYNDYDDLDDLLSLVRTDPPVLYTPASGAFFDRDNFPQEEISSSN